MQLSGGDAIDRERSDYHKRLRKLEVCWRWLTLCCLGDFNS